MTLPGTTRLESVSQASILSLLQVNFALASAGEYLKPLSLPAPRQTTP